MDIVTAIILNGYTIEAIAPLTIISVVAWFLLQSSSYD